MAFEEEIGKPSRGGGNWKTILGIVGLLAVIGFLYFAYNNINPLSSIPGINATGLLNAISGDANAPQEQVLRNVSLHAALELQRTNVDVNNVTLIFGQGLQ